jgi:hypothetical protein
MSVIIKLLSKFDNSGIRAAQKGFSGLSKTVGAIGIGFGLKAITSTLIDSAKAASADAKSTQLLNTQLIKNANATSKAITGNDKFIETLSLETGIMDDDLRPAMGKLVRATNDVDKAQGLLTLSLDAATVAGKPVETVAQAMARAFTGNKTALIKLFPALKESKDLFGDLEKIVGGAAIQQADPFMILTNSMDILKEKLGVIVLPLITGTIKEITKPGGLIESVGKFFEDVANPKTDIGKAFRAFGDTVVIAGENLKAFFALMDPKGEGNAMSGFASSLTWVATTLQTITDGLLVFAGAWDQVTKGNFGEANALMSARTDVGAMAIRNRLTVADQIALINKTTKEKGSGMFITDSQGGLAGTQDRVLFGSPKAKIPKVPSVLTPKGISQTNNVTINVLNADPKATVDALGKYIKTNGSLPYNFYTRKVG